MHNGIYLVKFSSDDNKNNLRRFLKDNNFRQLFFDEDLDFLLINIFEKTFKSVSKYSKAVTVYSEKEFYKEVNHVPNSKIQTKRLFDEEGNLLYEGNTLYGKPYGLGTVYFSNGNKYQDGIFDVKGFIGGREYYPNGQLRFEGKYEICSGYEPNYPVNGRVYDENGNLKFSGSFKIQRSGLGYPLIKNPAGYRIHQENHPKYEVFMWDDKKKVSEIKHHSKSCENKKEIKIYQMMSFCKDVLVFKSHYNFINEFTIDCINSKIIPNGRFDSSYNDDCKIYNEALNNVLKNEIQLDRNKLNNFLKEFKKLELTDLNSHVIRNKTLENCVAVMDSTDEKLYGFDSENWLQLGKILNDLVGFDILNIEAAKYLITDLYYDFKQDGVYEKSTKRKLKLKSICYCHGLWFNLVNFRIHVDFEKKEITGIIHEDNVSDETLNLILSLLEKYHVYELNNERYWQKYSHHMWLGCDGYKWSLSLIFEDGKHWIIGDYNDYPDIFTCMGKEIIELSGIDILNISSVSDEDLKLYDEYGDKILKNNE